MAREEIIECAINRAEQHYGRSEFKNVVYVGDGSWDAIAARRLGIGFVAVRADQKSSAFEDDLSPVVDDFSDSQEFVRLLDTVISK